MNSVYVCMYAPRVVPRVVTRGCDPCAFIFCIQDVRASCPRSTSPRFGGSAAAPLVFAAGAIASAAASYSVISGSRVVQGQDGLGRVWESEFWAENKGGPLSQGRALISVFRLSYIHILKS